jgi:hypothetical protein
VECHCGVLSGNAVLAGLTFARVAPIIFAMASIVSVVVSDDIDGSEGAETVTFGVDGVTYEIDLSEQNRAKLAAAMAPFIGAARKVSVRRPRTGASRQAAARVDRAEIRAWAKEQGLQVSERGRISAEIMQEYEAAH